tara:strand:+ start:1235 stop:1429 length:195 start_codon:yes stop_codon:yes gene_type:complete
MMGLGTKVAQVIQKGSELNPGPGSYDCLPNEIAKLANANLNLSKNRGRNRTGEINHTFGASREQ